MGPVVTMYEFAPAPGTRTGKIANLEKDLAMALEAQVSELHANFIVTDRGDARAADVRALGDHVRATVAERFGVELRYEIEFVGDWPDGGAA